MKGSLFSYAIKLTVFSDNPHHLNATCHVCAPSWDLDPGEAIRFFGPIPYTQHTLLIGADDSVVRLVVAHGNHWRAVHSSAADGLVAAAARVEQVDGRRVAVCNGQLGLRFPFLPTHTHTQLNTSQSLHFFGAWACACLAAGGHTQYIRVILWRILYL